MKINVLDVIFDGVATRLVTKYGDEILPDLITVADKNGNLAKTMGVVKSGSEVRWLEEGNSGAGWIHILKHKDEFTKSFGISSENEIENLIYLCIKDGTKKLIPESKGGGFAYVYNVNPDKPMTVIVGSNGFIVTSYPGLPAGLS